MVDVSLLQSLSYVAAAIGVCVAAFYYVSMIRNMEKIRRRDMVFQKLNINTLEHYKVLFDVQKMVDWDTFEEFERKYSYWVNTEARAKVQYLMNHYNGIGILLKEGIVEAVEVYKQYSPDQIVALYEKFKLYLDRYQYEYMDGFRFLYGETKRRYPDAGKSGLARSLDEIIERARQVDASARACLRGRYLTGVYGRP